MTTITFSHHKGGTGKTTSCLNIAGFCALSGKKVLVVDCDPQANATSGLGVSPEKAGKNMYDVFMSRADGFSETKIQDIILKTDSGIDLAPSHLDLVGVEPYLYQIDSRERILRDALDGVRDRYDFIMIDTPPSMGQFVINGLFAADHIVVTLDSGSFALDGVSALTTIFSDMKEDLGKEIHVDMAIVSRWAEGASHECPKPDPEGKKDLVSTLREIFFGKAVPSPEDLKYAEEQRVEHERLVATLEEIRKKFPEVFTVPYSPEVYESQKRGKPLSHYAPESAAGRAYKTISDVVMKWN